MILLDLLLLPAFVPVMAEESDSDGLRSLEKEIVRWIVREDSLAVFVALIRQQEVGRKEGSFARTRELLVVDLGAMGACDGDCK